MSLKAWRRCWAVVWRTIYSSKFADFGKYIVAYLYSLETITSTLYTLLHYWLYYHLASIYTWISYIYEFYIYTNFIYIWILYIYGFHIYMTFIYMAPLGLYNICIYVYIYVYIYNIYMGTWGQPDIYISHIVIGRFGYKLGFSFPWHVLLNLKWSNSGCYFHILLNIVTVGLCYKPWFYFRWHISYF